MIESTTNRGGAGGFALGTDAALADTTDFLWLMDDDCLPEPEALEKLKGATDYTYGAPVVFMVGAKPEAAWVRKYDGKNGGEVDAAIAGTHIMLEATALGLGNVWVGSFDPEKIKADFPETAGYEIVCLFPVGVPATDTSANHDKRKTMKEFASTL